MSEYTKFDSEIYSEESYQVTESEHDEVMRLMAEEGYQEFSAELERELDEQEAWKSSKRFNEVIIKEPVSIFPAHTSNASAACGLEA